jgi:ligand-binding sensor domain-containing protein
MNTRILLPSLLILILASASVVAARGPEVIFAPPSIQGIVFTPNSYAYAGTFGKGVFRSMDHGLTWVDRNAGLPDDEILAIESDGGGRVFVGTFGSGIFRSDNEALSWSACNEGLESNEVVSLKLSPEGSLYAGTSTGKVYYSTDRGDSWRPAGDVGSYVNVLLPYSDCILFAGTSRGLYASTDQGATWTCRSNALGSPDIWGMIADDSGIVYAASNGGGVYVSADAGATWKQHNRGLTCRAAGSLAVCPLGRVYIGTTEGVFYSTDSGQSWIPSGDEFDGKSIRCMSIANNGHILTGLITGGVAGSHAGIPLPERISDLYDEME